MGATMGGGNDNMTKENTRKEAGYGQVRKGGKAVFEKLWAKRGGNFKECASSVKEKAGGQREKER